MGEPLSRRDLLKVLALPAIAAALPSTATAGILNQRAGPGWVVGHLTGAQALVETLLVEGTEVVFGIPGAQENELWDTMKARGLAHLLVTHEFAAATMADGYARATGKPGVFSVVPGPGLTNSLSGLGEALLDSIPLVAIVGDIGRGDKYRAFQVHDIAYLNLLQPVTKAVLAVECVRDLPTLVRQAFLLACSGEPGPVAVVVPYNLFIESAHFESAPLGPPECPLDEDAFGRALCLLADRRLRVGLYGGLGCMNYPHEVQAVAELLQAPVATTVSGKGVISDTHPLAVGYGYGPFGTRTAEHSFKHVDLVLAIGVRYGEVATAFYNIPKRPHLIQVDINPATLGRVVKPDVCVHADAGQFLTRVLGHADEVRRPCDGHLHAGITTSRRADLDAASPIEHACGVDPVALLAALRCALAPDALVYVDVTQTEHWAAELFPVYQPRTYFNPTDNQAMGWSIPASIGGQRGFPGRQVVTVTGDGCFLMSAMEITTAAREGLPVKFFVLDDQAYHYMQSLQKPAYLRTTATILARLDYAALAKGFGVGYAEIQTNGELATGIQTVLCQPGPVLVRVVVEYGKRPCRWIDAAKARFTKELSVQQKVRFLARIGSRAARHELEND